MTLPKELATIFQNKQKSYKMVLVIAILNEMNIVGDRELSLQNVKERFLALLQERENEGEQVDQPPGKLASKWADVTLGQVQSIIDTPIQVLSSIIDRNLERQTIGFRKDLYDQWDQDVLIDLYDYTQQELADYYNEHSEKFSLHNAFNKVMTTYLDAKKESFKEHEIGTFVRQTIPNEIRKLSFIHDGFKVKGSVGNGKWADIPWIAVMDKRVTNTTQQGEYIVYLFAESMKSVYLTLAQGVTIPQKEKGKREGSQYLREKASELRLILPLEGMKKDEEIYLTGSGLGEVYQDSTIAYYRYDLDQLPDESILIEDLRNVIENYKIYVESIEGGNKTYNQIEEEAATNSPLEQPQVLMKITDPDVKTTILQIRNYIVKQGFYFPDYLIENLYLSLKTKPFVILAGISGSGKTRLVRLFAEAVGATSDNGQFSLIPVRPDWSDPSDLIGYRDIAGSFKPGPLSDVIVEATKPENLEKPYFICLDEMNLARVEHYFSDVMSLLETQEWSVEGQITTDAILPTSRFDSIEDQELYGDLRIPENIYIIGTVNMDETTYPFSKKILDRANTLEFNYINLLQLPILNEQFNSSAEQLTAHQLFIRSDYLKLVDAFSEYSELVTRTTEKLSKINDILEDIHAHVGFRIRDAVCFYLIYNERFKLMTEEEAFDFQLMQKILPRIQGSHSSVKRVLLQLMKGALGNNLSVNELMEDASSLYTQWNRGKTPPPAKHPQSARKLAYMLRRLEDDGFTSYWLS
ncbi:MrcB family domain-containing protein [Paenibacillus sp. FSL K6-2524]|uniref:MrcB family domain-containing protein n=1 Tax=Paenibacillus sp. FSL K6-2524 TaxID=2954516 RepID=UPI0030F9878E